MEALELSCLECDDCFEIEHTMKPNQKITCMKCGYTHTGTEWTPITCQLVPQPEYEEHA